MENVQGATTMANQKKKKVNLTYLKKKKKYNPKEDSQKMFCEYNKTKFELFLSFESVQSVKINSIL